MAIADAPSVTLPPHEWAVSPRQMRRAARELDSSSSADCALPRPRRTRRRRARRLSICFGISLHEMQLIAPGRAPDIGGREANDSRRDDGLGAVKLR